MKLSSSMMIFNKQGIYTDLPHTHRNTYSAPWKKKKCKKLTPLNFNSKAEIMAYFNRTVELIQFSHSEGNNRSKAEEAAPHVSGPATGPPFLFTETSTLFCIIIIFFCKNSKNVAFWLCCTIIYCLFWGEKSQMLKGTRTRFQLMNGDLK